MQRTDSPVARIAIYLAAMACFGLAFAMIDFLAVVVGYFTIELRSSTPLTLLLAAFLASALSIFVGAQTARRSIGSEAAAVTATSFVALSWLASSGIAIGAGFRWSAAWICCLGTVLITGAMLGLWLFRKWNEPVQTASGSVESPLSRVDEYHDSYAIPPPVSYAAFVALLLLGGYLINLLMRDFENALRSMFFL